MVYLRAPTLDRQRATIIKGFNYRITPTRISEFYIRETDQPPPSGKHQPRFETYLEWKAMARLKEVASYLMYIASNKTLRKKMELKPINYKAVFITLTLPSAQKHNDRVIKQKLLQPILRILRNRYKVQNYIWKAEANKNGNIHFHITTDKFIPWRELRTAWNTVIETLSYVTNSGLEDPNSIDVHAVYKINNIGGYLAKYISKNDLYKDGKPYEHWDGHYYQDLLNIEASPLEFKKIDGKWQSIPTTKKGIKRVIEGKKYDCNEELKRLKLSVPFHQAIDNEFVDIGIKRGVKSNDFSKTIYCNIDKSTPTFKRILDHYIISTYYFKRKIKGDWLIVR